MPALAQVRLHRAIAGHAQNIGASRAWLEA
jgi:hypothetical protein